MLDTLEEAPGILFCFEAREPSEGKMTFVNLAVHYTISHHVFVYKLWYKCTDLSFTPTL